MMCNSKGAAFLTEKQAWRHVWKHPRVLPPSEEPRVQPRLWDFPINSTGLQTKPRTKLLPCIKGHSFQLLIFSRNLLKKSPFGAIGQTDERILWRTQVILPISFRPYTARNSPKSTWIMTTDEHCSSTETEPCWEECMQSDSSLVDFKKNKL